MGTLRFFEEVVSFKIRRTFGFADYTFLFVLLIRELFRIRDSKRIKKLVGQPFLLFPSVASGTRFRISELWT